ncbi:MAG: hypothetical protein KAX49_11750 [Halanaerobiales bacterium]|nr:hypothetical protein [Halanaerobiales bacterium]
MNEILLIAERRKLEADIEEYVDERLNKFYNETAILPSSISISLSNFYNVDRVEKVTIKI